MRDSRIKSYDFTPLVLSGTITNTQYSDHVINGEILSVNWKYGSQGSTGSISIFVSGTQEVFCSNIALSGTKQTVVRPRVLPQGFAGSVANASLVPYVCNDKIGITATALLSGATNFTCSVLYR
jgi:hypothetical protein